MWQSNTVLPMMNMIGYLHWQSILLIITRVS